MLDFKHCFLTTNIIQLFFMPNLFFPLTGPFCVFFPFLVSSFCFKNHLPLAELSNLHTKEVRLFHTCPKVVGYLAVVSFVNCATSCFFKFFILDKRSSNFLSSKLLFSFFLPQSPMDPN